MICKTIFKTFVLAIFCFASRSAFSQAIPDPAPAFEIIDISQKQLQLANRYQNEDSMVRSKIFADTLYQPYKGFWGGYIGEEADFVGWMNTKVLPNLAAYNKRNQNIDGNALLGQFNEVRTAMTKLTGFTPRGAWYIAYGPAWTDLGGLSGGTMLIDLSHENNSSNKNIMKLFPHELTHQIFSNVNTHNDTSALGSIIGEGFAVFMNQLYWKNEYNLAENLGYSQNELDACVRDDKAIKKFFDENKYSTDREVINKFRNRGFKLKDDLPGAIGYYIGYLIIDRYVKKFGESAWKDVFQKSPREIYEASGF